MTSLTEILPTQFAPAERADNTELQKQVAHFKSDALLKKLLDAVPDIVLILNEYRQTVFANEALLKLVGLDENYFIGLRPGEILHCVHTEDTFGGCGTTEFCRTCGAVQAILISQRGTKAVKECRIIQKGGDALDLQVTATPMILDGQMFTIFAVKDISSEKRRRALERIFFHDLLNTASGVIGLADILEEADYEEMEFIKHHFSILSRRLIEEINAQKALADAENNELTVQPMQLESLGILKEIQLAFETLEIARDRSIQIAPEAQSITFVSDYVLLQRVIGNMVKNALEASKPGQRVTLSCRAVDGMAAFSVHNPAFMPRDVQLQIFQRSFSTKGSGRGLGTYSIKLLSERYLNGSVSFMTSPEHGTTFTARYPIDPGGLMDGD